MVYIKSHFTRFPDFPSDTNAWSFFLNHPFGLPAPLQDHVMFIDGLTGFKRTRYEFIERVEVAATALSTSQGCLGLEPTDIVAVLSENCLDYATLVNALLSQTVPFALFSAHVTQRELRHCLKTSNANHVFVHANLLPVALSVCHDLGFPKDHIYILEGNAPHGFRSFDGMIARAKEQSVPRVPIKQAQKNTLAYMVFSSGTTGLPKAVMISHRNMIYSTLQYYMLVEVLHHSQDAPPPSETPAPIVLSFLPFYHTYGLYAFCFRPMSGRATYIIMPRWNLSLALKLTQKYQVTVLPLVPPVVHQLATSPEVTKEHFKSVTSVWSGAAHLPPATANSLIAKAGGAFEISGGYGLTEMTAAAISFLSPGVFPPPFPQDKLPPNTTGVLIPGVDARIVREDGSDANYDEIGELWLTGENVALGYRENPKATSETFFEDEQGRRWLKTGDAFRVDKAGFFFFEDRIKDTLKVNGLQVSPTEIEGALLDHPDHLINDAAVAGVTLKGMGGHGDKVPRAWVVLSPLGRKTGKKRTTEELEAWMKQTLSKYKWLKGGIEYVDEIPKSLNGKVLRRKLVDEYEKKHKGERAKL